ncbi:hypothetical protein ATANTOWER_010709 [Ataeniobius toweri]|uniref:Uncharacterized protein n=1 Tax=Ataeniobius toweri TaxID=208326 RepID=A0ABU7BM69_9TELE|nr:hypothetical protein [Ataeniobius toweri]
MQQVIEKTFSNTGGINKSKYKLPCLVTNAEGLNLNFNPTFQLLCVHYIANVIPKRQTIFLRLSGWRDTQKKRKAEKAEGIKEREGESDYKHSVGLMLYSCLER